MKVYHLYSSWRWTGPAEPALNLAGALHGAGWDTTFLCGREPRGRDNGILRAAQERGVPTRTGLNLSKHINPFPNYPDSWKLRRWMAEDRIDLVHAHLRNAHIVAALAARRLSPRPLVVRSCYAGEGPTGYWEGRLVRELTDGLLVISERARREVVTRFGFPADRVWMVHTAIDLDRFDPGRGLGDRRAELGIAPDAFVVGIVARIQWRRRYHVFLEAIDRARRELPGLRAILVGRGTHMNSIVVRPIQKRGLADTILLPGYHTGDDFVRTLGSMDAQVMLVPGTDGSCRAVREAMAMGVPVIAARRGILPELVADGERGLLVDDTPENLARAILTLARQETRRRTMGERAREYARNHFALSRQADIVGQIYRELAERGML